MRDWLMLTNRRPAFVTWIFLPSVAASRTQAAYVNVGFYRHQLGPVAEASLTLLFLVCFAAVLAASLRRSARGRAFEWPIPLIAFASFLATDLIWRWLVDPLPLQGFKIVAVVLDAATPLVAALGIAAALAEWRGKGSNSPATAL